MWLNDGYISVSEWLLFNANSANDGYISVSEWLLFNDKSANGFQLYRGENKLIFNEMMMRSTLY